ncbi:reverse transcriptase domain-containing protein [Prosthecomicrobium hirschii]|uniref:reverse transcriptase domain-containing protein n=1 Tax=Prosthecodimorpha hirschii TaxID=665126 RepID=UPI00221E3ECD|nr:reverse transcriptase domain-containing protein [Prosthecomicrobium hirschii]
MSSVQRSVKKLIPISIPQEFSSQDALLSFLGLGPKELKKIWWFRGRMYKKFSISKDSGKVRIITAPDRRLKIIQRKLAPLLYNLYLVRNPVHGFVLDRSVKTNANAHGRRRFVVNLDIQDFFPTITEKRVRGLLFALGVDLNVSSTIARLCCVHNCLPQGAPTSPVLSNMICYRIDTELMQFAKELRVIYTRYADDITFSGFQAPINLFGGTLPSAGHFSSELLSPRLREIFSSNGFKLNSNKSHYADKNSRRIVTGVKINAGLNVDRKYIRHIRALLHSFERQGEVEANARYTEAGGKGSLENHLRGKISYIVHLKGLTDPVVRGLALRFNRSFAERPIRLAPTAEEKIDRSVWIVEHSGNGGEQGTAFFLKGFGLVTAAHCVEESTELIAYHPSKPNNKAKIEINKYCSHRDLAILNHKIHETEYFELDVAAQAVAVGHHLTAYGYPDYGPGDKINVRIGTVTSLPMKHAVQMIEVTQELAQGMSGGPILDLNGEVIGIAHKGGPHEGRQLAIHIRELQTWGVQE